MIPPTTPTESVAATIANALCSEGLVPVKKKGELLTKLSTGRITASEWRLFLELAIPQSDGIPSNVPPA
jgi:hypothetical protein